MCEPRGGAAGRDLTRARLLCSSTTCSGGARRADRLAEVFEDVHDRRMLDDERNQPHVRAAVPAAQRVDFVDARDQLRMRGEYAVVAVQVPARRRDEARQPVQ